MRLARSILAVILGYMVFALTAVALFRLSGRNPHAPQPVSFMLMATCSGMLFAGLGGLLTARMAPARGRMHAGLLALLIAVGAGVSIIASPSSDATWSQWTAMLLMAPSAYVGARLFRPRLAS